MADEVQRRSQPPGLSCGGPASSTPILVGGQQGREAGSSSAMVERGESSAPPSSPAAPPSFSDDIDNTSVIRNVTVENCSALDCSNCHHPLKPPIFQCSVGHVVCSPCHDKLRQDPATSRTCHVCRALIPDGYFRCNAMEQVVDSIRIPAPPEPSPQPPPQSLSDSTSVVIRNVTVENSAVFDCSICYHPLKPPIFQCNVGHVVCSPCNDKLGRRRRQPATRCHVCRTPTPGGYSRCDAMEKVVDSIRVPCPHAAHGCGVTPAYHDRDAHAQACTHRPCRCPVESCGFSGSVLTTLPAHFAAVHGWPCSAGSPGTVHGLQLRLRVGVNVVTATAADHRQPYTMVLNVEQAAPVCNAITAFCIHPSRTATVMLGLSYYRQWRCPDSGRLFSRYQQSSQMDIVCTDLSDGMPGPSSSCIPFLVPRSSATPGGEDGDDISVTLNYIRAN